MLPDIDPSDYPHLFTEHRVEWWPLTTIFQLEDCPDELVCNVAVCPYIGDEWVIIRLEGGLVDTRRHARTGRGHRADRQPRAGRGGRRQAGPVCRRAHEPDGQFAAAL